MSHCEAGIYGLAEAARVAHIKNPDTGFLGTLVWIAVIAGAGAGGWFAYKHFFVGEQRAIIKTFSVDGGGLAYTLLRFEKESSGDPTDVVLVFSSKAMSEDVTVDWKTIAAHDMTRKTLGDRPPPLGQDLPIKLPIRLLDRYGGDDYSDIMMSARLYWGGVQQDLQRASLEHIYKRER